MKRIGLLSDTHGYVDARFATHFADCDEIWHAGDIGSMEVIDHLRAVAPVRAVHGNVDGGDVRRLFPQVLRWRCEEAEIMMTHIGGYPGRYDASIRKQLYDKPPHLFISGHSHILKVQFDPTLNCLHINPGAAGLQGWQTVRTLVRFTVDGTQFRDLEVIELTRH
ncbi:MAG: metallophosphoesterase family protein [Bacteroidaceae bacterium]|nr:metallophosphoesterase family protein [Bacteroidaceae bacterium]